MGKLSKSPRPRKGQRKRGGQSRPFPKFYDIREA
jgi:hypothetical protein